MYRSATERSPNRVQPPPSNLQHKEYFTKEKTRKDELAPCQIIDWLQLQQNYAEIGILCDTLLKKPWNYSQQMCYRCYETLLASYKQNSAQCNNVLS